MKLTTKQIEQFRQLYKEKLGKEISTQEAQNKGLALVNLMRLVYKPITKEDLADLK